MTNEGVKSLYLWLSAAWPEKIRPGVDDTWKRAKLIEMYGTWKEYDDAEVMEAYQKWTEENSKFPTTHDIINEIEGMSNPNHIELLKLRYIDNERFEAIACTMGYSYDHVIRMHGEALAAFGHMYLGQ